MALARIITRSHHCSRELALDLLARGYAVEIVSPEAVPDNFADLELRVDTDAANELTARVEARDGDHATSLDFVHHLKAPIGPFLRRPPEAGDAVYYPANPVNFNAEPDLAEEVELPSGNWRAPEPQRPRLEILPVAEKAPVIAPPEQTPVIAPPEQPLPVTQQSAKHARHWITIKIHRWKTRPKQRGMPHSGAWVWRAGVAFAAVTVMALVLARGVYRGEAAFSVDQASQVVPKTVSAPEGSPVSKAQPEQTVSPIVPAHQENSEAKPAQITKASARRRLHAKAKKPQFARSQRRTNDLIAPDTVTYLDKPASGVPARNSSRTRASSRKQDALAAAKASPL